MGRTRCYPDVSVLLHLNVNVPETGVMGAKRHNSENKGSLVITHSKVGSV